MKFKLLKFAALATLCVCTLVCPAMAAKLNIKTYLSKATEGVIYPSAAQIEMLDKVVGNDPYVPFPASQDRKYWDGIAKSKDGKALLKEVEEFVDVQPEVPISDEIYRRA